MRSRASDSNTGEAIAESTACTRPRAVRDVRPGLRRVNEGGERQAEVRLKGLWSAGGCRPPPARFVAHSTSGRHATSVQATVQSSGGVNLAGGPHRASSELGGAALKHHPATAEEPLPPATPTQVRGGGSCPLTNLRTLCRPCHLDVSAQQRAAAATKRGGKARPASSPSTSPSKKQRRERESSERGHETNASLG